MAVGGWRDSGGDQDSGSRSRHFNFELRLFCLDFGGFVCFVSRHTMGWDVRYVYVCFCKLESGVIVDL